jgi:hydrogenase maturation protease
MNLPPSRVLIAGIGNIFLGDDAFGCEVIQRMLKRPVPQGVRVIDFGIRGLDLAYSLLQQYETVILVDAVPRGEAPGTLYVIEPDVSSLLAQDGTSEMIDAHTMHPGKVLRLAVSMGARLGRILLVGCEPTPFDPELDMQMELSKPVLAALDEAIRMVDERVTQALQDARQPAGADATSPY